MVLLKVGIIQLKVIDLVLQGRVLNVWLIRGDFQSAGAQYVVEARVHLRAPDHSCLIDFEVLTVLFPHEAVRGQDYSVVLFRLHVQVRLLPRVLRRIWWLLWIQGGTAINL